jgi:hypothetical protein
MAEVVEDYRFKSERLEVDWDKVLDGQTWFLERGVDIDMETPQDSFRNLAYLAGKRLGVKVKVNKSKKNAERSGFFVRAISKETESR